jgi:hypothetical protein
MALGLNYNSSGGDNGDIIPFVKYDARAGRFFRNDRTEINGAYSNNAVDITSSFKAVMDLENLEVGYLLFAAGSAPQFLLVKLGDPMPQKPTDAKWKQGVRVMMKLHQSCGGDVRETSSNAAAFLKGFDELHSAYEASKAANPGKLPIVTLKTTTPITSGSGDKKSTNYQPVFEISGWAPRPVDLVHVGKGNTVQQQPAASNTGGGGNAAPPSTGSTQVSAPAAKQLETAGADDFG